MRKLIERCPACGGELVVTKMSCHQCHTGLEGCFRPASFDLLPPESLAFIELFVRLKGNMKEMERELAVPYSTVRHRLDEVVRELGPTRGELREVAPAAAATPPQPTPTPTVPDPEHRRQILDRLDRGELTPDEAVQLLGEST